MTISATSPQVAIRQVQTKIDATCAFLLQEGAHGKAGVSSKGKKASGTRFDTTADRWWHHLGYYYTEGQE